MIDIVKNQGIVISAFPGSGKSYLFNNDKKFKHLKIIDLDSSGFSKDNFPKNYVDHISKKIYEYDVILVSSHDEVRREMQRQDIEYFIAVPRLFTKNTYRQRYIVRGDDDSFTSTMMENWDSFLLSCTFDGTPTRNIFFLDNKTYVSDVLKRIIDKDYDYNG